MVGKKSLRGRQIQEIGVFSQQQFLEGWASQSSKRKFHSNKTKRFIRIDIVFSHNLNDITFPPIYRDGGNKIQGEKTTMTNCLASNIPYALVVKYNSDENELRNSLYLSL